MTVAVTGASGHLGRAVADELFALVEPDEVVLVTRNPDHLVAFARRGATVRYGDFDRPDSMQDALTGVERALLISTTALGRRAGQHGAAIDAAHGTGVRHVVYTSILNPIEANPSSVVSEHRATEHKLKASGLAWTLLRNDFYAELPAGALGRAIATGQLVHNYGDGRIAWVTRQDCAAVAAAVLAGDGHEDKAYDVTGPELFSGDDLATLAATVSGVEVSAVAVDDEAYIANLIDNGGLPEAAARGLASSGRAIRDGYFDQLTTVVADLSGRPARRLQDVLVASLA
jgi:NAD(P)H dehydrogenase (quinone)